jgi:DNA-binding SARP family transcriptional activator
VIRLMNRLATAVIVLAVVAGPPAAITVWALSQRPWPRPTAADLRAWLADPPPQGIVLIIVTAAGLALWLLVTVIVVRTIARTTARAWRRLRRLPLPTPAQVTAGSLAGTALLGLPAITATNTNPGPPAATSTGASDPGHDPFTLGRTVLRPAQADQVGGLELPDGGWIAQHDAENVTAMAALFWLRRRQTDQPSHHGDAAPPMPAAALAAAAQPRSAAGTGPLSHEQLPAGHLALTGPGAHAAARGLLVTTLMANTAIGAPRAHIMIDRCDLTRLLDDSWTAPPVPGLHLTDTMNASALASDGQNGRRPAVPCQLRIASTGTPGEPVGGPTGTTVLFDADADAPPGAVWRVDADGRVAAHTASGPVRMCVLTAATAADLLSLISRAHGLTPDTGTERGQARSTAPDRPLEATMVAQHAAVTRPVRLHVLGELRLAVAGRPVSIRRTAGWQILVLLAAHHPHGLSGRDIITAIWPEPAPATITKRLYTTLTDLRADLKPHLQDRPLIIHQNHRYHLDANLVDVDLWKLRAAARTAADGLTTDEQHRAHHDVIGYHRGELATGHTWPWLAPHRESLRHDVIKAYAELTDGVPAGAAIHLLREAISVDPYNEHLHRRAITALTALGDHAAARRLYDAYTSRLTTGGLQPGPDIRRLADEVASAGGTAPRRST